MLRATHPAFLAHLALLTSVLTIFVGGEAAAQSEAPRLRPGTPVSGQATSESPHRDVDYYGQAGGFRGELHTLIVPRDGSYDIEATSHFFDTLLVLWGANGSQLAIDDDGGFRTHSKLRVPLVKDVPYTIAVCSTSSLLASREPFHYTLRVTEAHATDPASATPAPPDLLLADARAELQARREWLEGDQDVVAASLHSVAACLEALDRHEDALPLHREALAMLQRLGAWRDVRAASLSDTAHCLTSLGRWNEALPLYQQALELFEAENGGSPTIGWALCIARSAACLKSLGRLQEANDSASSALSKYDRLKTWNRELYKESDNPRLAELLQGMATCHGLLERWEEALPRYEHALAVCRRLHGREDHPKVVEARRRAESCLASTRRADKESPRPPESLPREYAGRIQYAWSEMWRDGSSTLLVPLRAAFEWARREATPEMATAIGLLYWDVLDEQEHHEQALVVLEQLEAIPDESLSTARGRTFLARRQAHHRRLLSLSAEERTRCGAPGQTTQLPAWHDADARRAYQSMLEQLELARQTLLGKDDPWTMAASAMLAHLAYESGELESACERLAKTVLWSRRELNWVHDPTIWGGVAGHYVSAETQYAEWHSELMANKTREVQCEQELARALEKRPSSLSQGYAAPWGDVVEKHGSERQKKWLGEALSHRSDAERAESPEEAEAQWNRVIEFAKRTYPRGHLAIDAYRIDAAWDLAGRWHPEAAAGVLAQAGSDPTARALLDVIENAIASPSLRDDIQEWFALSRAIARQESEPTDQQLDGFEQLTLRALPPASPLAGLLPLYRAELAFRRNDWSASSLDDGSLDSLAKTLAEVEAALRLLPPTDIHHRRARQIRDDIAASLLNGSEEELQALWHGASRLDEQLNDIRHILWEVDSLTADLGFLPMEALAFRLISRALTSERLGNVAASLSQIRTRLDTIARRFGPESVRTIAEHASARALVEARSALADEWWDHGLALLDHAIAVAPLAGRADELPGLRIDRTRASDPATRRRFARFLNTHPRDAMEIAAEVCGEGSVPWALACVATALDAHSSDLTLLPPGDEAMPRSTHMDVNAVLRTAIPVLAPRSMIAQAPDSPCWRAPDTVLYGYLERPLSLADFPEEEFFAIPGWDVRGPEPEGGWDPEVLSCLVDVLSAHFEAKGDWGTAASNAKVAMAVGMPAYTRVAADALKKYGIDAQRRDGPAATVSAAVATAQLYRMLGRSEDWLSVLSECERDRQSLQEGSIVASAYDVEIAMAALSEDDFMLARSAFERARGALHAHDHGVLYSSFLPDLALAWLDLRSGDVSAAGQRLNPMLDDLPPFGGQRGAEIAAVLRNLALDPELAVVPSLSERLLAAASGMKSEDTSMIFAPGFAEHAMRRSSSASDGSSPLARAKHHIGAAYQTQTPALLMPHAMQLWNLQSEVRAARLTEEDETEILESLRFMRPILDSIVAAGAALGPSLNANETKLGYEEVLRWKGFLSGRQWLTRALERDWARSPDGMRDYTSSYGEEVGAAVREDRKRGHFTHTFRVTDPTGFPRETTMDVRRLDPSVTPSELAASLPPGTVLLDFLEYRGWEPHATGGPGHESMLAAFVVRSSRDAAVTPVVRVELGPTNDFVELIRAFRAKTLGTMRLRGLQPGADAEGHPDPGPLLRERFWLPIAKAIGPARRVLVCPDGPVAFLPLGALPGAKPGSFLIEDHAFALVQAPSVLLLDESLRNILGFDSQRDDVTGSRALLVGGLDFGQGGPWAPLAGSREEVEQIGRQLAEAGVTVTSLLGRDATPDRLLGAMTGCRILHIASHAASMAASAMPDTSADERSFLVLSGANEPNTTARLHASDIEKLDLDEVQIAVLSACETGLGEQIEGEGMLGLQRAFELAGAGTVVGSLWKVPDRETQLLMQRLHENLWVKRLDRIEALREAQLWLLSGGAHAGVRQLPQVWAAWQLSGEWR